MAQRAHYGRRIAKWIGLFLCLLVLVACIASIFWMVVWSDGRGHAGGLLRGGAAVYVEADFVERWNRLDRGWIVQREAQSVLWWPDCDGEVRGDLFTIPAWIPLALLLVPTACLWWFDRRRIPPGHCRCGYDLSGLCPATPCAECGRTGAPSPTPAP